jgi:AcrR family transcriptional regulator
VPFDADNTQTSRRRLLDAGRMLFALQGFEQTSTAAIAREAGTSESQLVRNFVSKAGLLEAILTDGWKQLQQRLQTAIAGAASAREAMDALVDTFLEAFHSDPELEFLLLFEGHRLHGGFAEFQKLMGIVIDRGRRDGTFDQRFHSGALALAIVGAAGALMRERSSARREHHPQPFTEEDVRDVIRGVVAGLSSPVHSRP